MKKSAGKMFIEGFFKSAIIIFIIISVGILSYQGVVHFFDLPEEKTTEVTERYKEPETITEAQIDDISKNLIFCVDEKSGKIKKIVLEVFHCEKKELNYITLPVRTQFTMSDTLYRKLILVQPNIPQVIKLSAMNKYFPEDTVYDYGLLLVEDLLDMPLSYYTVIPKKLYDTIFTEENKVTKENSTDNSEGKNLTHEVFSKKYIEFLGTLKTAEDVSNYIEEIYSSIDSNLDLDGKMNYLESYCETPLGSISFDLIAGEDNNSAYRLDDLRVKQQLADLLN